MSALDRKLFRDLLHMRGQVLAICLVMACGVATFVMSLSMLESLVRTLDTYYERYRFAEVFTHVERAPNSLLRRLAEIPGVGRVQTRIVENVTLDMPGLEEPAVGRLVSLPRQASLGLNDVYLRAGRPPDPAGRREVIVSEAFALAHGLALNDTVTAVMNGRRERLRVVGFGMSPEFIYQIRPGELVPDDLRYGVFWLSEIELAAAFDMEGAFNDVTLTLMPGASEPEVIARLDAILRTYGSLGAYGRADHASHQFVSNEIEELRGMAKIMPAIFLAVAAFLLNVVLSRLISTQREQIAALKALGYGRGEIAVHYLKLVGIIVFVGVVLGAAAGAWMGAGLTRLYSQFFHFPIFEYHLRPAVIALAFIVSGIAALLGTLGAVRRAAALPPAEAMRPQPPAEYRPTIIERAGLERLLSPAARMILRQLERRPLKAALSCLGISLATSILVLGYYMEDAIDYALAFDFELVQKQDVNVTFIRTQSPRALAEVRHLPGVHGVEPFRALPARLRSAHRSRRVGIMGLRPDARLFRPIDADEQPVPLPPGGIVMSEKLADLLAVGVGDPIAIEILEESRPVRQSVVAGVVTDFSGTAAYMHLDAANRMMRHESALSGAFLTVDPDRLDELHHTLKGLPGVAGVTVKSVALESFRATIAENIMLMRAFNIGFAVIIAFGVVYNTARISLSERSRELATLRVIGFTRAEISFIQLGELAVLNAIAIPGGLLLGYALAALTSFAFDTELFRIPLVVSRGTYAFAATVIMIAALCSGLVVRRMLDRLDLVAVLKTRE
ncbi:MAG: FtsX-like permease family protein [Planctomycetes bacterium]|nr:FtsX-like permease family protein [Planctomycetota bacterium]